MRTLSLVCERRRIYKLVSKIWSKHKIKFESFHLTSKGSLEFSEQTLNSLPFPCVSQAFYGTLENSVDSVDIYTQMLEKLNRLDFAPCETSNVNETLSSFTEIVFNSYNAGRNRIFRERQMKFHIKYSSTMRKFLQLNIPKSIASRYNTIFRLYVLYLKNAHRRKPIKLKCQSRTWDANQKRFRRSP